MAGADHEGEIVESVAIAPSAMNAAGEVDLTHQVSLDSFAGPLDLLLYLVRRAEVDIAEISIADITDQFVAAVSSWADMDLEMAGDFILMAATLLEIKSRMVAPPPEAPEGEQAEDDMDALDPRSGLIRQLLAYQRCKEATQWLTAAEQAQTQRCARQLRELIPDDPDELEGMSLENCDPGALWSLWESVLIRINGLGPRTVINDDQPIEGRITSLIENLRASGEARLSWLFAAEPNRVGRVGILMATLECARQRFIEALQHEQFGEVFLRYHDPVAISDSPTPAAGDNEEPRHRRRRPPLATWHASAAGQPGADEAGTDQDEVAEEVVESDEQRFLRELEEACAVEAVIGRVADLEGSFVAFLAERHAAEPPSDGDAPGIAPTPEPVGATPESTTEP